MNNRRTNQSKSRSTRVNKRSKASVTEAAEPVRSEMRKVKRKTVGREEEAAPAPVRKPRRVAKTGRRVSTKKPPVVRHDTRMVILATSPRLANLVRVILGRSRADEPDLKLIIEEIEDQLSEMGK